MSKLRNLRPHALAEAVTRTNLSQPPHLLLKSSLLTASGAALIGSSLLSAPVQAQDGDEQLEEVVVTGSRIRRQDFEANSPITTIDRATFEETSTIGIETVLNQLPQFVPALTQFDTGDIQNSAINTVGSSTVSLRGLGANRNLVLIDGRRGQPVNSTLVVDTNSIPSSAIERVEIISGGASAVYGADAVGGVVNFILKDNYEGFNLNARYGATEEGANEEYQISALFGANVADGRGNVMVGIDYSQRARMTAHDTGWRVDQMENPNILSFGGGNDFWFAETYVTSQAGPPSQAALDTVFSESPPGSVPRFGFGNFLYINPTPDGSGTVFSGAGWFGAGSAGGAYKYNGLPEGQTVEYKDGKPWRKRHPNGQLSEMSLEQWTSIPLDRFSFFSRGSYDVTDNVTAFGQTMFSRNRNSTILGYAGAGLGSNGAPVPYGTTIWADSLSDPDDPDSATKPAYLPGGAFGLTECPAVGGCTESQVFPLPPEMRFLLDSRDDPEADIVINRSLDFMGYRRQSTRTTTFQINAGLEGVLDNGWAWDTVISHGQTETNVFYQGFTSLQRWREMVASPNFAVNFQRQANEFGGGRAAGIATCTTGLPLIRDFEMSEDCKAAMQTNNQNSSQLEQNFFQANLTGDIIELPAGPLSFAVGAEYRNDEYIFITDNNTTNENFIETTLGNFPTSNTVGRYSVEEIYAEALIPVITNVPGIRELNLELGGRLSDYSSVGEVETWKALVDWSVNDWSRVRGGFQRATRAPNLGELFLARTNAFAGTSSVWNNQCSEADDSEGPYSANPDFNINGAEGAQFTREVCSAMMGQQGAQEYYAADPEDQSTNLGLPNTVGNPDVQPEDADTWTVGVVIESPFDQNPWLAGLRASIDWYEIEITNMIATEGADPIFERCLSPELNPNQVITGNSCDSINFDPFTGNVQSMDLTFTNEGRALTSGVDLQVDWTGTFGELGFDSIPGGFSVNMLANYNRDNITQVNEETEEVDWVGTRGCALGLQCMGYEYRAFTTFSYFNGPLSVSLRWQYYPDIKHNTYATNPETDQIGVPSSYNLFRLSGGYQVNDNLRIMAGVENLFDKLPPLAGGDPDNSSFPRPPERAGGDVYDPLGRRFYINAVLDF